MIFPGLETVGLASLMGTLFFGLTGGLAGAKMSHVSKKPQKCVSYLSCGARAGWTDQRGVGTGIRRHLPLAAIGLHFMMGYILTKGRKEAYRRDVTLSDSIYPCYKLKYFEILKHRCGQAQPSLFTPLNSSKVPKTAMTGEEALHEQAEPGLAGVACHQNWQDKPLPWGVLFVLDEGESQLDSTLARWARFLRRCRTGWCLYFGGSKDVRICSQIASECPYSCWERPWEQASIRHCHLFWY